MIAPNLAGATQYDPMIPPPAPAIPNDMNLIAVTSGPVNSNSMNPAISTDGMRIASPNKNGSS